MLTKYMHVEYKMKTNKYQALGTGPKLEQNKIDTTSTHIYTTTNFSVFDQK